MIAQLWRDTVAEHPDVHVVANADDPMVVWAALPADATARSHLVQRRPALAGRLVGLPGVRLRHPRSGRRLAVRRLRAAPPATALDGRGRLHDRPGPARRTR